MASPPCSTTLTVGGHTRCVWRFFRDIKNIYNWNSKTYLKMNNIWRFLFLFQVSFCTVSWLKTMFLHGFAMFLFYQALAKATPVAIMSTLGQMRTLTATSTSCCRTIWSTPLHPRLQCLLHWQSCVLKGCCTANPTSLPLKRTPWLGLILIVQGDFRSDQSLLPTCE